MEAVLAADPKNISALLLLAYAEHHAGDNAAALGTYRTVLSVDSSNVVALNNLAYNLPVDNSDEALKFAQQAAEIAPDNPTIQDTLGWVYYRKGLYSMAVRYLKTASEKQPTPIRQFHLGMCYLKVGDREMGKKIVSAALLRDPPTWPRPSVDGDRAPYSNPRYQPSFRLSNHETSAPNQRVFEAA